MSAHLDSTVDKENVGPAGKPARLQQGAGLSSGGRRVLARRDNLLPAEGLSTGKHHALKDGLKLWKQETPQSTARLVQTPAMAQVGHSIFQDGHLKCGLMETPRSRTSLSLRQCTILPCNFICCRWPKDSAAAAVNRQPWAAG